MFDRYRLMYAMRKSTQWLETCAKATRSNARLMFAIVNHADHQSFGIHLIEQGYPPNEAAAMVFSRLAARFGHTSIGGVNSLGWMIAATRSLYNGGYDFERLKERLVEILRSNDISNRLQLDDWLIRQLIASAQHSRHDRSKDLNHNWLHITYCH